MPATTNSHAPFRADQVGSLLRPAELMTARDKAAKGEITRAALTEVENRLIQVAVKAQEDTGIQAITDGDFRRQSWSGDFLTAIEGVKLEAPPLTNQQQQQAAGTVVQNWQPPTPKTVGPLRWPAGGIQRRSFEFLKGVTTRTAKTTIPPRAMGKCPTPSIALSIFTPVTPEAVGSSPVARTIVFLLFVRCSVACVARERSRGVFAPGAADACRGLAIRPQLVHRPAVLTVDQVGRGKRTNERKRTMRMDGRNAIVTGASLGIGSGGPARKILERPFTTTT